MESEDERPAGRLAEGVVTAVVSQKKDATRVSVFIDGAFAFGVAADVAASEGVREGQMLTVSDQERILSTEGLASARVVAFAYLSRRARTSAEMRQKLDRSGFGSEVVDAVVQRLTELHYLDDREYAQRYVASRLDRKYGPRRIVQELRRRGITPTLAEEAVSSAEQTFDVRAQARTLAQNRAMRLQGETDERKRKKKIYDFLVRRGYESELAWSVVNSLQENRWN